MTILSLYDRIRTHHWLRWISLALITTVLALLALRLTYKEDIADFLPLSSPESQALEVFQGISGSDRLFILFKNTEAEATAAAIATFTEELAKLDTAGWTESITTQIDVAKIEEIFDFTYANIPYFLTREDYTRMDSLLAMPGYLERRMKAVHEQLLLPSSSILQMSLSKDPLGLFTPVASRLQEAQPQLRLESYDGYIFTPDMKWAVAMLRSPFGSSETQKNEQLLKLLDIAIAHTTTVHPSVQAHVAGAPKIAVGNASQIKHDSILAVSIAVVLILALLIYSFRSLRNILLVGLSIGWGWLFALAGISLFHTEISMIIIGIASIIIGIAVNYPLHLIAHVDHTGSRRTALRELIFPLVVGNITTVGAFLTLTPLQSVALRDLGLFAALLLVGTIVFVILYLPHWTKPSTKLQSVRPLFAWLVNLRLEKYRWVVVVTAVLTLILAFFIPQTGFDADMSRINYMSDQEREDLAYFERMLSTKQDTSALTLYVPSLASTIDEALAKQATVRQRIDSLAAIGKIQQTESASPFLSSEATQRERLALWRDFAERHRDFFTQHLPKVAEQEGFSSAAFEDFYRLLDARFTPQGINYFAPLTHEVLSGYISLHLKDGAAVVDKIQVDQKHVAEVRKILPGSFDVTSLNSAMSTHLSDNFNYIGWACSAIVFLFLWLSFGRLELALLSFIPMAVSWVWILGLMGVLGIKFNIVNVILASFIFGQGDDYTIFMTEGSMHEYAYRRPTLESYKQSIIISMLMMFVGIGSLIVAEHPALYSLAVVVIIGMLCVVFMAYLLPPLIFRFLVADDSGYRRQPITLGDLLRTGLTTVWWFLQLGSAYVFGFVLFSLLGRTARSRSLFHRYVTACYRLDMRLSWLGVEHTVHNSHGEDFVRPAIIICNHQSLIDPMYLMALSPKILIMANRRSSFNPIVYKIFQWLDFYTIDEGTLEHVERFQRYIDEGYSIAVFPEAERNPESSILRFHKGPFFLAEQMGLDIIPLFVHGANQFLPINNGISRRSRISLFVDQRISPEHPLRNAGYSEVSRRMRHYYCARYATIRQQCEDTSYFLPLVRARYLYKGASIWRTISRRLKRHRGYTELIDRPIDVRRVVVTHSGYGEFALLLALVHPELQVTTYEANEEQVLIARYSAEGIAPNLSVLSGPAPATLPEQTLVIDGARL